MTFRLLFGVAAFAAFTTPVLASDLPETEIDISDLDLSDPVDQQRLDRRIDNAARRICNSGSFEAAARKMERECRETVKANAAPKIKLAIVRARTERLATIDLNDQV